MIIYNCLFILLIISVILFSKENKISDMMFGILGLIVILIPGLRDISVGTDTTNYARYFSNPDSGYDGRREVEAIYSAWNQIVSQVWDNVNFYFFVSSFVAIGCVIFFIKKNSPKPIVSLLLFVIITEFYFMYFSAMRQILSMGFILVSLHYYNQGYSLKENKVKMYITSLLFFCLAVSFHTTSAYCLPVVLLVSNIDISKKVAYILLIGSFFVGLFNVIEYRAIIALVFDLLDGGGSIVDRYDSYAEGMDWEVTTYRRIANMLPLTLVCMALYYFSDKENRRSLFLKLFMIGIVMSNVLISYPIGGRLVMYLTILVIIAFPLILYKKKKAYVFISIVTIVYFLYKANASLISQFYGDGNIVVPYKNFF